MEITKLNNLLGNIDLYLLDQLLKNRFSKSMKILDAGCGEGRNAVYFIQNEFQIFGIDPNELAIQYCRYMAKSLNSTYDSHRFQVGKLEEIPFHAGAFDAVICSAVLHFAESRENFWEMINEIHRILKPGGIFWFRMCTGFSDILDRSVDLEKGRYLLPDGSERFVLTQDLLDQVMAMGFRFLEDPKTILVLGQREMGVFTLQKLV